MIKKLLLFIILMKLFIKMQDDLSENCDKLSLCELVTDTDSNDKEVLEINTKKDDDELDNEESDTSENPMVLLPGDPKEWTSQNIESWLKWTAREFQIEPPPNITKFPETGNELCSMTKADFWVCAGSKRGGNILAKHVAHLIHSATGKTISPLLNEDDPGFSSNLYFFFLPTSFFPFLLTCFNLD